MNHPDVLIVGAGIVGLSLARSLSARGVRVRIVDQGEIGKEASWAGAGILTPSTAVHAHHPIDQLKALSFRLHREWAAELSEETGIDTGFRQSGGVYIARSIGEAAALRATAAAWKDEQILVETWDPTRLADQFPGLSKLAAADDLRQITWLPEEAQIRNPHHLQALAESCRRRGVRVDAHTPVASLRSNADQVDCVLADGSVISAGQICLTSGAWTYELLAQFGISTGLFPMRGQMLLFQFDEPLFGCLVNEGSRYVVPRDDGHILVGSTEEEVGFDKSTTQEARDDLFQLATALNPKLTLDRCVRQWSGLRPASFDGFPYMGQVPDFANLFVAAGHFRSGLFLSPGTAQVMSELMLDGSSSIDLEPFRPGRK